MWFLTELAERRIAQARDAGELDDLPGAGQPLPDDIDPLVPEHQRIAYRVLKNAGYLPPELDLHKEAVGLALQLAAMEVEGADEAKKAQLADRLGRLNLLLAETGQRQLVVPPDYASRLATHLARH
ncbi:DnaJ family domain-containing protein [Jeongeupia sp. USM3]|uniref:DnaJ family domain-containing protein n=1 Tax=Jeongeupia sp. USM3 TaxID=1906741 RepID=UPI00089E02A3|nr:DnaJ family domain-containing protein [Jeongeupia sp. USM3]AOX99767.1 hypothetical protein BJP62_04415 [Jeongeupia sp. USM3]